MGHKKYRICLLMVAVAATVGGILYYCFCIKEDETMEKGTLVKQMQQTGEKLKEAGRSVKEDMAQAFSSSGRTIKETAVEIKEDMANFTPQDLNLNIIYVHKLGGDYNDTDYIRCKRQR